MQLKTDTHIHSLDFSGDAVSSMDEMCRGALAKGLERICFTEHVDFDVHYDDSIPFDAEKYKRAVETMRERYGAKLEILKGIEVGEPHVYPKEYEKVLQGDAYDVVIASVHYVMLPMGIHWTGNDGKSIFKYAVDRIYRRYYEDLLAVARLGGFDVLGHFDYPKRYLKRDAEEAVMMREILDCVVKNGGVIEINTSPLRKGCKETSPGEKILKMYCAAGGKRLTIGSDAHRDIDIAAGFDIALALAENFTKGYFKNRKFCVLVERKDDE